MLIVTNGLTVEVDDVQHLSKRRMLSNDPVSGEPSQ